jgi:uncharacterized short protein YbdD (DUF466 family)
MNRILRLLRQTARLMVGQPSYEAYLEHLRERHPARQPMTRVEFFRNREQARYGQGGGRCC